MNQQNPRLGLFFSNITWLIQLNALAMSVNLFLFSNTWFTKSWPDLTVDRPFLKPPWRTNNLLSDSKKSMISEFYFFSMILPIMGNKEMGLRFPTKVVFPDLGITVVITVFHCIGKEDLYTIKLSNAMKWTTIILNIIFNNLELIQVRTSETWWFLDVNIFNLVKDLVTGYFVRPNEPIGEISQDFWWRITWP